MSRGPADSENGTSPAWLASLLRRGAAKVVARAVATFYGKDELGLPFECLVRSSTAME